MEARKAGKFPELPNYPRDKAYEGNVKPAGSSIDSYFSKIICERMLREPAMHSLIPQGTPRTTPSSSSYTSSQVYPCELPREREDRERRHDSTIKPYPYPSEQYSSKYAEKSTYNEICKQPCSTCCDKSRHNDSFRRGSESNRSASRYPFSIRHLLESKHTNSRWEWPDRGHMHTRDTPLCDNSKLPYAPPTQPLPLKAWESYARRNSLSSGYENGRCGDSMHHMHTYINSPHDRSANANDCLACSRMATWKKEGAYLEKPWTTGRFDYLRLKREYSIVDYFKAKNFRRSKVWKNREIFGPS